MNKILRGALGLKLGLALGLWANPAEKLQSIESDLALSRLPRALRASWSWIANQEADWDQALPGFFSAAFMSPQPWKILEAAKSGTYGGTSAKPEAKRLIRLAVRILHGGGKERRAKDFFSCLPLESVEATRALLELSRHHLREKDRAAFRAKLEKPGALRAGAIEAWLQAFLPHPKTTAPWKASWLRAWVKTWRPAAWFLDRGLAEGLPLPRDLVRALRQDSSSPRAPEVPADPSPSLSGATKDEVPGHLRRITREALAGDLRKARTLAQALSPSPGLEAASPKTRRGLGRLYLLLDLPQAAGLELRAAAQAPIVEGVLPWSPSERQEIQDELELARLLAGDPEVASEASAGAVRGLRDLSRHGIQPSLEVSQNWKSPELRALVRFDDPRLDPKPRQEAAQVVLAKGPQEAALQALEQLTSSPNLGSLLKERFSSHPEEASEEWVRSLYRHSAEVKSQLVEILLVLPLPRTEAARLKWTRLARCLSPSQRRSLFPGGKAWESPWPAVFRAEWTRLPFPPGPDLETKLKSDPLWLRWFASLARARSQDKELESWLQSIQVWRLPDPVRQAGRRIELSLALKQEKPLPALLRALEALGDQPEDSDLLEPVLASLSDVPGQRRVLQAWQAHIESDHRFGEAMAKLWDATERPERGEYLLEKAAKKNPGDLRLAKVLKSLRSRLETERDNVAE